MTAVQGVRYGLVGPGRRRNGLGPFLAREMRAAGAQLVAVAGRDPERTAADARALGAALDESVEPHTDLVTMLCSTPLDALVIAAPIEAHETALRAALAAGVPALCEKPLVDPAAHGRLAELVGGFVRRRLPLRENCQLPYVLPAYDALHPGVRQAPPTRLEMLMAPSAPGRAMVVDSVSHLISVVQALVPVTEATRVVRVAVDGVAADADRARVDLELETPFPRLHATLYLAVRAAQPRPQWIAIDGARIERRIDPDDYSLVYRAATGEVPVPDPLGELVADFVRGVREPDDERTRTHARDIVERARLYSAVIDAWDAGG